MKKLLVSDLRKVLSVFLATLMLLTAWTIVMPERAVAVTAGTYYVKVYWNVGDDSDKTNWWYLDYKDQNGNQQTGSTSSTGEGTAANSGGDHSKVIAMNGVPNKINYQLQNAGGTKLGSAAWYITKITIGTDSSMTGETILWQGSVGCKCEHVTSQTIKCTYNIETNTPGSWSNGNGQDKRQETSYLHDPFLPTLTKASFDTADNQPADITIPSTPTNGAYTASTSYRTHAEDQYGVRLCTAFFGNNTPTATVSFGQGVSYDGRTEAETSGHNDYTISVSNSNNGYDVTTYKANRRMEKADVLAPKLTVTYSKGDVTKSVTSESFNITDPTYVHKLYNNGGMLYYEGSDGEKQMTDGIGIKQFYYTGIGGGTWDRTTGTHTVDDSAALPTRGERLGYTYMGMYSKLSDTQSTTDAALINTSPDKWNKSTRESEWDPTKNPQDVVVYEKLDDNGTYKVTKDKNWCAAWQANLCKVTIYDYRGAPTVFWTTYGTNLSSVSSDVSTALATHPGYQRNTYNYQFAYWYIAECYKYQADGTQEMDTDSIYTQLSDASNYSVKGDLSIKPKYEREGTYNHYTVTFKDTAGVTIIHNNNENYYKDYRYNEEVAANHTVPSLTMASDNTYDYTFAGWTTVDPGSAHYFMCDSAEEAASVCEAFAPVTCNITYYPVFYKTYINYTVNFVYVPDELGASNEDATGNFENHTATYHYGDTVAVPSMFNPVTGKNYSYTFSGMRYIFTEWNPSWTEEPLTCTGNRTYTAVYGELDPATYTVSFVDTRGTYGTVEEPYIFATQADIVHGTDADQISVPTPEPKDKDGYRYTFNGWQLNGVAATPTLTEITADATYSATWRRTVLCDVEFYNGSEHIEGADLHDKTEGEPISYVGAAPSKAPDKIADNYEWIGWLDADGNPVEAIPGGTTLVKLYANYLIHYHDYTITFKNDVGETILERTDYHYGDTVAEPTEAQRAKAADNTYNYTFTRWDKPIVDVEADAVYTAVYLSHYNYYEVKWLNNDGTSIYSSSSYIYNERITAPFTDEDHKPIEQNPPQETPPTGYTRDFIGWKHYETGTPGAEYNRSDRCGTSGATYIATFGYVADLKTITLYDRDGETRLGSITVPYNSKLNDEAVQSKLPTPKMYKDAEKHYDFDKYVNLDGSAYNYNAAITDNLSLKASYIGAAHTFKPKNVTTAPTFEAAGAAVERCDVCGYERDVTVPKLVDTIAPTATLFVRDVSWNGSEETATLEGSVTQTANANTVVITTKDTAQVEPNYNPSGDGSMVRSIDVVIEKYTTVREAEDIDEDEWFNIYTRAEGDVGNA